LEAINHSDHRQPENQANLDQSQHIKYTEIPCLFLTTTMALSVSKLKVVNFSWIIHPSGAEMVTRQTLEEFP
jgi:hypothetical protein